MTASTINADETYRGYTITQDHSTGFWSISSPAQAATADNELYGAFTDRARIKRAIDEHPA